jgi:acetyltransferase-like isoleucine patch superfamily enzyme
VTIGAHVSIGANARIYDHDFHPLDPELRRRNATSNVSTRPVVIGDDVFIGAHAIILKGVVIGARAVIGAGAVVSKDVPPGEVWAGNPARKVGALTPSPT